jgi:C-terminal processing protease CtpA/Prc
MLKFVLRLAVAVAVVALVPALAPTQPPPANGKIDAAERKAVIAGVLKEIEAHYVFPDVGKQMVQAVRDREANKEYDAITGGPELAAALTQHLRAVCKDKHLGVRYSPEPFPKDRGRGPSEEARKRMQERAALRNFGFKKVERLGEGGVGLLQLDGFLPAELIADTAAAAMGFLANNDAVIIDLRRNGGGSPDGVILLCSYFFDEPRHLNSIYTRSTDTTRQYWSHPVAGKKLVGKDVYVLTSSRTFSAAEEFTYNLQSQKRATVVGETTGGGAHPTRGLPVTDHFGVGVPFARSINPVTKTNWEGTGVKPDVAVPAEHALHTAQLLALKKAAAKYAGDKDKLAGITREMESVQKELDALVVERQPPKFALGVMLDVQEGGRVKIDGLVAGGAAEKGGLKAGDVLLKAGGKPLGQEPMAVLAPLLQTGEPIEFEIERDGKKQTVTVKPGAR